MTKNEYLIAVATKVTGLKGERAALYDEAAKLVGFYTELIDDKIEDGMDEEAAVASMESPDSVAERVRREMDIARAAEEKFKASAPKKTVSFVKPDETIESMGEYTRKTAVFSAEGVKKIEIIDENHQINITRGDGGIGVSRVEGPDGYYEISEGETLSVRFVTLQKWYHRLFNFGPHANTALILKLPKDFDGELDVHTTNGAVSAENVSARDNMKLRTSNGAMKLTTVAVSGRLQAETSNGYMTLNDVAADLMIIKTSNGTLNAANVAGNVVKLTTSNAKLSAGDITARDSVELITSNGSNAATAVTAPAIAVKTSNSSIKAEKLYGDSITLKSSNGSITGILPGAMRDYAITSSTSNGKNNLPPATDGKKSLDVRTSNAKIDIAFEE